LPGIAKRVKITDLPAGLVPHRWQVDGLVWGKLLSYVVGCGIIRKMLPQLPAGLQKGSHT